ncbi:MAG: hypothetical protein M0Q88_08690 [Bacilli bacterium]|jgi:hypothetical protein|nr:hypothetical protein [Bacilli bacterium]
MYVYIKKDKLFLVGHYDMKNHFITESTYTKQERAAERVSFLNGGLDMTYFRDIMLEFGSHIK